MPTASRPPKSPKAAPAAPSRAWRRGDAERRRQLIVDAALKLLHKGGPEAVTMRRVADKLGVGAMTLYTYLDGQRALHREMIRRGFERLHEGCSAASTLDQDGSWRGGADNYIRFAIEHPNLFRLMFDTPLPPEDQDLLDGGFQPLLDRVRQRFADRGITGDDLEARARAAAGRYWLGLHGLAMVAISGRLGVLAGNIDQVLDDLLQHIAPG